MKCACPTTTGAVRRNVTFERPVYAQDAANEQIATWVTYATLPCTIRAMTSREVVQSEQVQGSVGWIIEGTLTPKSMGVTSEMRAKFNWHRNVTAYCDGPAMPTGARTVKVRAVEQTA